jgi:hypothetical protein
MAANPTILFKEKMYAVNYYMDGVCPECRDWEAPITEEELVLASSAIRRAHRGATKRVDDKRAGYTRQTWHELFECPCGCHFAVPFSNI